MIVDASKALRCHAASVASPAIQGLRSPAYVRYFCEMLLCPKHLFVAYPQDKAEQMHGW